jgi:hypothetical protein
MRLCRYDSVRGIQGLVLGGGMRVYCREFVKTVTLLTVCPWLRWRKYTAAKQAWICRFCVGHELALSGGGVNGVVIG